MKKVFFIICVLFSGMSFAQYKTNFQSGDPILASEINMNFLNLKPQTCVSGTKQFGIYCVETTDRAAQNYANAMLECRNADRVLCPAKPFAFFDQTDDPDFAFTDGGASARRWVSDQCNVTTADYHEGSFCVISGSNQFIGGQSYSATYQFRCCYLLK